MTDEMQNDSDIDIIAPTETTDATDAEALPPETALPRTPSAEL